MGALLVPAPQYAPARAGVACYFTTPVPGLAAAQKELLLEGLPLPERFGQVLARSRLLTALRVPARADLPQLLAGRGVEIAASLPACNAMQTDAQRGNGIFEHPVQALRRRNRPLNARGARDRAPRGDAPLPCTAAHPVVLPADSSARRRRLERIQNPGESMAANVWQQCSVCKKPILYGATYYKCAVSTCNRKSFRLYFCCPSCWDAHNPGQNHRNPGYTEETAPRH